MKILNSILVLCFFITGQASAKNTESSDVISYVGQEKDSLNLINELLETRYRTETQDSTCSRQVPYEDQECEMVPRYERVCRTIPGYNDCRNVYDRQCRNVTRYRQQCSTGPSRRECRTEPSRQQCRTNRTTGERVCRTIPANRICQNKPGRRTCRQVPYNDRVCENVSRRQCDWVPSRQDCNREYTGNDRVCRNVTRYRTETYACQIDVDIPYTVKLKDYNANVEYNFFKNKFEEQFDFKTTLNDRGNLSFNLESNKKTPIVLTDVIKTVKTEGKVENITAKVDFKIYTSSEMQKKLFPLSDLDFTKEKITFNLPSQNLTSSFKVFLRIKDADEKLISRSLKPSEIEVLNNSDKIIVNIALADLAVKLDDFKTYNVALKLNPIFKSKLAFPLKRKIEFKKSLDLAPRLSENSLEDLTRKLNQVNSLSLSTSEFKFAIPKHIVVKDIKLSLETNGKLTELNDDNLNIDESDLFYNVTIKSVYDPSIEYKHSINVKYIFNEEFNLPADYEVTSSRVSTLKPTLTSDEVKSISEDAKKVSKFRLYKKYIQFRVPKNEFLNKISVDVLIKFKSRLKLEHTFKSEEIILTEDKDELIVLLDVGSKGADLKRSTYRTTITVNRSVNDEINIDGEKTFSVTKKYKKKARTRK